MYGLLKFVNIFIILIIFNVCQIFYDFELKFSKNFMSDQFLRIWYILWYILLRSIFCGSNNSLKSPVNPHMLAKYVKIQKKINANIVDNIKILIN